MAGDAGAPLQAAVDAAYHMFSGYRLGSSLNVCRCPVCVSDADELALRTTQLRQIPARLLAEYTGSAHSDGGDEFLYFLPRYFELLAAGETPCHIGRETCLRRLGLPACRASLTPAEASVCDAFLDRLLFEARGSVEYADWPAGRLARDMRDYVIMAVYAGRDIADIIADWESDLRPSATVHIAAIICDVGAPRLIRREALWPWSDDCRAAEMVFQDWLEQPSTSDRIELLFLETEDRDASSTLGRGSDILNEVRQARRHAQA